MSTSWDRCTKSRAQLLCICYIRVCFMPLVSKIDVIVTTRILLSSRGTTCCLRIKASESEDPKVHATILAKSIRRRIVDVEDGYSSTFLSMFIFRTTCYQCRQLSLVAQICLCVVDNWQTTTCWLFKLNTSQSNCSNCFKVDALNLSKSNVEWKISGLHQVVITYALQSPLNEGSGLSSSRDSGRQSIVSNDNQQVKLHAWMRIERI